MRDGHPVTLEKRTVFTFHTDAERQAFIDAIIDDLGCVPEYATAQDADQFLVFVRLPAEAKQ